MIPPSRLLLFALALSARGAAQPDTLALRAFQVRPMREDVHAMASASTPDSTLMNGFERSSLRSAMVWLPGIQMDERGHGGSTRLSIRGSLLRAPYGVRGVKVYWGSFPLTLADGSTPLELLDPLLVAELDVVRSVGGPLFGSAPSGLILAAPPLSLTPGADASGEAMAGPDGYYRLAAAGGTATGGTALAAGALHQRNDGYREQEWSARDQAFITTRWITDRTTGEAFVTWQHGSWALPGSIDSLTALEDPRSAREYARLIDAHVDKQQVLGGIASSMMLGPRRMLQVRSSVHGQWIEKLNPYGASAFASGDKDESIRATGARVSIGGDHRIDATGLAWELGLEALLENDRLDERSFDGAEPGDLRISADIHVSNFNGFAQVHASLPGGTDLTAGVGSESTTYDHDDLLASTKDRIEPPVSVFPSAAIARRFAGDRIVVHLRHARSVSRPTVWELLGSFDAFNDELGPEKVSEWECGIRFGGDGAKVRGEVCGYLRLTNGLILPEPLPDGTGERFVNAGDARQNGIEAFATFLHRGGKGPELSATATLTLQDHEVEVPGVDGARAVPGVPATMAGSILAIDHARIARLEAGFRAISEVAACLACGDRIPSAVIVHARLSRRLRIGAARIDLFAHVENLLDARYTSFVQLNDPGGRYYNPAPGRGFYAGIRSHFGRSDARH